jgi:hypothetical protein
MNKKCGLFWKERWIGIDLRVEADAGTELKPGILNKRHFLGLKTITTH